MKPSKPDHFQRLQPATLFAKETLWQSWLDVEATLAEVQSDMGMIPAEAGPAPAPQKSSSNSGDLP